MSGASNELKIVLLSFGFKHGLPSAANLLFDVRFLPNPYWIPELAPLTGLDPAIHQYFNQQTIVQNWLRDLTQYLATWLPHFNGNSQQELVIAVGCTGGQHRSVYIVERLASLLRDSFHEIYIEHRDSEHWTQERLI
jgi:UPF0042 nucleotide-binding protein